MFRKNRRQCKTCEREYGRNYNKKHFNKRKKWRQQNADRMTSLQANWYTKNKLEIREKNKARYHADSEYKKRMNIKRVIQGSFKRKGRCKYWNCSYDFLVRWLTFNFNSDMTIETNGTLWHQDHVIPKNKFKLIDDNGRPNAKKIRLCFSWFNLSPISGPLNMSKHDKINIEQLKQHVEQLREFGSDVDPDYYKLCEQYITNTN
jgi:hypothetical protein